MPQEKILGEQLNIIDVGYKSKYSSLMSLVNKCKTPMGRRYLAQKLLNPTIDSEYLNTEYDIIEHTITCLHNDGEERC